MTVSQLQAYAKKVHLKLPKTAKKVELISMLERWSPPATSSSPRIPGGPPFPLRAPDLSYPKPSAAAASPFAPPRAIFPPVQPSAPPVAGSPVTVAGITRSVPQGPAAAVLPTVTPFEPARVTMARLPQNPAVIKINVVEPKGSKYLSGLHSASRKAGSDFIVNTDCAPDVGNVISMLGKKAAILQQCIKSEEEEESSTMDCNSNVLYAEIVERGGEELEWQKRLSMYNSLSETPELAKHTLRITSSWLCDSSKFEYDIGGAWLGSLWTSKMRGSKQTAFCIAEIPNGYQLWTLRNFMRSYTDPSRSSLLGLRTLYNVAATSWSWRIVENRYIESGMLELTKKMLDTGLVPDEITPETYGVLVKTDSKVEGDDVYPVILPVPQKITISPVSSTAVGDGLMILMRTKIFDSVVSGFMIDGAASVYKPSRDILKKMMWATGTAIAIGGVAYGGATLLTYMGYLPMASGVVSAAANTIGTGTPENVASQMATLAGSVTSVNQYLLAAYKTVSEKAAQSGTSITDAVAKVFGPVTGGVGYFVEKFTNSTGTFIRGLKNEWGPSLIKLGILGPNNPTIGPAPAATIVR